MNEKMIYLKENGIDVDTALTYLGDMETFDEILRDFIDGLDNQLQQLEDTKNSGDISNYAILVHALKSNCRSLGIVKFADLAYQHEMESKAGNAEFVNRNFNDLVMEKDKVKEVAEKYFN